MPGLRCLNCDSAIDATARFCPQCSQRADTARLSFSDILRDLMQTFVNMERGPLAFALALLVRPGVMAREYIEGKRRRHYGPFATLVVLAGLTVLAINVSGYKVLAQDGLADAPTQFLQRHFNLLLLVHLPLLGGFCALLFRGARLSLPEHMVLAAYALSVRVLVLALIALVLPLVSPTPDAGPTQEQVVGFWAAWYVYFGWVASQFYAGRRAVNWIKGMAAAALTHRAIILLINLSYWFYERLAGA